MTQRIPEGEVGGLGEQEGGVGEHAAPDMHCRKQMNW